jgi:hypothetical protein
MKLKDCNIVKCYITIENISSSRSRDCCCCNGGDDNNDAVHLLNCLTIANRIRLDTSAEKEIRCKKCSKIK